jgi:uncharacterized protein YdcH (DUF465 family)
VGRGFESLIAHHPSWLNNSSPVSGNGQLVGFRLEEDVDGVTNPKLNRPMDLHHPLLKEFPEYRETIQFLKVSDSEFRQKFDEYHKLDDAVCRIEEQVDFATDQETDELKMKRARLKDEIYRVVTKVGVKAPTSR